MTGYDCTFEQNMCGWTQSSSNTIDWFREQAASNNLAGIVGPLTDHTYGNATGYYITTRLQLPVTSFDTIDTSTLISPLLPTNGQAPMCADWWYMMHGTDDTELNLFLVVSENYTSPKSFWRRSGDQGRHWQHGQLQIDVGTNVTRVVYETIALFSIRSEVSLDDLTLTDGPCIKPDFYSIACTFEEEHICGYASDPTSQLAWTRNKGSTPSFNTGATTGRSNSVCLGCAHSNRIHPVLDHTLGTPQGHFMFIGMFDALLSLGHENKTIRSSLS